MRLIMLFCWLFCCSLVQAGEAVVTIDATTVIGPVKRLVLGGNLQSEPVSEEHSANRGGGIWDPERRAPVPEVMAALRRARDSQLALPRRLLGALLGLAVGGWPGGTAPAAAFWCT